jgi:hypothetical protein
MYIWLISNAVLVVILLQLIRQGNYTFGGFMAYMWLYYYAYQANASLKMKNIENELVVSEHK